MRASPSACRQPVPLLTIEGLEHHVSDPHSGERFTLHVPRFLVQQGEWIALIGHTGCGKTTLLHQLGLLRRPTQVERFEIVESGDRFRLPVRHDVRGLWQQDRLGTLGDLRCRVLGQAPQRPEPIPSFTVRENVEIPLRLNHAAGVAAQVTALLTALSRPDQHGIPDLVRVAGNLPQRISGGQAQRLGIARALVHRPRLLLLDEPTSNLDPVTARHVLAFLQTCRQRDHITIVMVTHDVSLVRTFADRLIAMNVTGDGQGGIVGDQSLRSSASAPPTVAPFDGGLPLGDLVVDENTAPDFGDGLGGVNTGPFLSS